MEYPKLGIERSGFVKKQGSYEPRIADSAQEQAYAVDTAIGQSVYPYSGQPNIWRITYMNSNSAEDVVITVDKASGSSFGAGLRRAGPQLALFSGLITAALFWTIAWYLLMPWLLGKERQVRDLWHLPLMYIGWNLVLFLPGAVLYFIFSFGEQTFALLLLVLLFGTASVLIFNLRHLNKLGVSTGKSIRAFIVVTFVSNGVYLLFVLGYAKLAGVL